VAQVGQVFNLAALGLWAHHTEVVVAVHLRLQMTVQLSSRQAELVMATRATLVT
jgi:hypothetical protein